MNFFPSSSKDKNKAGSSSCSLIDETITVFLYHLKIMVPAKEEEKKGYLSIGNIVVEIQADQVHQNLKAVLLV